MLRKAAFYSLLLTVASFGYAQEVDDIIAKHIEALGGLEKLKSIETLRVAGTMTMSAMGLEGSMTRIMKRPNLFRMEMGFQGQTLVQAFDGKTAWEIVPFMGDPTAHPMPEDQAKQLIREADFDGPFVDYKSKGHKIEFVGKEEVEGTETLKLKVTTKDGDVFYSFFDPEYYLELKRITKQKNRRTGTEMEAEIYFSDFKEVAGLMMPHALKIKGTGPGEMNVAITQIEVNVDVDDSLFQMPKPEANKK